jgi:hypothetical protein
MTPDRYIVIRVAYDRHPSYGRSLAWIAPELRDAGLTMTEDRSREPRPSRTWEGLVDGATFQRFADAWGLHDTPHERTLGRVTEAGHLAARAYTFDGMNWETGGESPIVYVSVLVGVVKTRYRREVDDALPVSRILERLDGRSGWSTLPTPSTASQVPPADSRRSV